MDVPIDMCFFFCNIRRLNQEVLNKEKVGTKGDIYKDKGANIGNSFFSFFLSSLSALPLALGGPR